MPHCKLSLSAALTVALAAGAMLLAGSVKAADLDQGVADLDPALVDPPQVMPSLPTSNVVFGSGWYARGDLGGAQLFQANPFFHGVLNHNPATAFYSDAPSVTFKPSHEIGYIGDLGGGYSFTPYLRADVIFDFHQPIHSSAYGKPFPCQNGYGPVTTTFNGTTSTSTANPTYGTCTGLYQASLQSYDALVNGYIDLGTYWRVTPYVGAGVGLSFGHYSTSSNYFQADGSSYNISVTNPANGQAYNLFFDRTASGTYYNVAYALMAGFAVDIFPHVKVDIGYRYLNLGNVLGTNLYTNEVRAGLRYMIDN